MDRTLSHNLLLQSSKQRTFVSSRDGTFRQPPAYNLLVEGGEGVLVWEWQMSLYPLTGVYILKEVYLLGGSLI